MQSGGRCGARGGFTLMEGSGARRKIPDPPVNFIRVRKVHFGRTREAVSPDDLNNRSTSQSVCVILNSSEFYEVKP